MILLDSSAWLELLANGPQASLFRERLSEPMKLLVPSVVIYETYKITCRLNGEEAAEQTAAYLREFEVISFDEDLAIQAAEVSLLHGLAFADSVVYATGQLYGATVVTSDAHFKDLPGVEYVPKQ